MLDLLERQVVPLYFDRNSHGYSRGWVARAKAAMKTTIPRFNAERMAADYIREHYLPAHNQGERVTADGWTGAQTLAAWKKKIGAGWPAVRIERLDVPLTDIHSDEVLTIQVAVELGPLTPGDVVVDLSLIHI